MPTAGYPDPRTGGKRIPGQGLEDAHLSKAHVIPERGAQAEDRDTDGNDCGDADQVRQPAGMAENEVVACGVAYPDQPPRSAGKGLAQPLHDCCRGDAVR